jgi:ABC-type transport system involved in cytochrome bd biosynthesis fused ATPase/permease subunit
VLLLDEADAHLDLHAAVAVDRLVAGFTGAAVVVTHRPERLATADAVYELSGGVLHRTA